MNIIKQKVRNLLFSIQTTGTAKHLVHIRINKQSAPVIGYANRAYSSLVYSRPFSEMPKQNWRFCCSGNPKIHVAKVIRRGSCAKFIPVHYGTKPSACLFGRFFVPLLPHDIFQGTYRPIEACHYRMFRAHARFADGL